MENNSFYLPGFHLQTLRRTPRSARLKLADERSRIRRHSISQLGACFSRFIPSDLLDNHSKGAFSRRRLFSKANTFWAFFSQVLDADGGCKEVVRKVQAFAASQSIATPSASTSAYCQARRKLETETVEKILLHTGEILQRRGQTKRWHNRRVVVVDGTGVSMPDTPANQEQWPQPGSQQAGCGFPQARICACFCLQTGALLSHRIGSRKNSELPLLRQQWESFEHGDIFLGDKGFCSYFDVSKLQDRGVDSVITLARRTPVEAASAVEVLGPDDLLIEWPKPKWNKRLSYSKEEWHALPDRLLLRQIKVTVNTPGFRAKTFYIVTTLLDANAYSASDLADLYYQRWDVELFFRDIKTTMGMDILRGHSPAIVEKEILMHFIAYNAVRLLMVDSAKTIDEPPRAISFKASVQALRQWEPRLNQKGLSEMERRRMMSRLLEVIALATLLRRPGRREPRCVKRRPKPFALMTVPRHQFVEIPHRSRYRAKQA